MSSNWWMTPGFLAFDTETTGIDPSRERIVTAAVIRFVDGQPVEHREWLLKIDIPIPPESTNVHGITNELSQRDGIDQIQALAAIKDALTSTGLPVVAFNSEFDIAMLNANLARHGMAPLAGVPVICPFVLDKQFNKYVRGSNQRRLAPTAARYGLELTEDDWHGAEADARIAGQILLAEFAAYPDLARTQPDELAAQIATWRAEQEAEFQAWLASKRP